MSHFDISELRVLIMILLGWFTPLREMPGNAFVDLVDLVDMFYFIRGIVCRIRIHRDQVWTGTV